MVNLSLVSINNNYVIFSRIKSRARLAFYHYYGMSFDRTREIDSRSWVSEASE